MSTQEKQSKWMCFFDVPHKVVMEERGITFEHLGSELQQQVIDFDKVYIEALKDGFIDEKEAETLLLKSSSIANTILEALEAQQKSSAGPVIGVLAGVGVLVAAAFGIRAVIKS